MTKLFALAGAALLILVSCGSKQKTESASQAPAGSTVLAKVNGKVLTYEDLKLQFPSEDRDKLRGKDLQNAIDTWISTEVLAQQGEKLGLDKGPDMDAIMRYRKDDAIAGRVLEHEMATRANVTQSEVDSAYFAQKENYKLDADRMRASHIIVRSKEEADAVYSRLKKGDDFAALAQDYSIDKQTAANGGDLGYFTADQASQFDPDFGKAVQKLKVGEFSQPIETKYGFHIIKLTDLMKAGTSLDSMAVKTQLSDELKKAKQGQALNNLIDSLKATASIERFTPPGLDLEATPDSSGGK